MRREHFDGDEAIEAGVLGAVDVAHTSGAERSENLVRAKASAGSQAHMQRVRDYAIWATRAF
jgi:hypothetical protein